MTKGPHFNYLKFNLIKVKRCQNLSNHHEQEMKTFFHDEVDQIEILFKFHKFWSSS
jgi:hypothetical protein